MSIFQDKVKRTKQEQEICIIFSRYPRPGSTKTRLVPQLGSEGAAALQRAMTEKVIGEARDLATRTKIHVELAISGASQDEMEAWLGGQLSWQVQVGTDLGGRMEFAFAQAFRRGFLRVVLVGADCPGVNANILDQAFQQLRDHEMVLGPTKDGGYYLIGLRRPCTSLFHEISWGSSSVFSQTLSRADEMGITSAILATLSDVDRAEDLEVLPPALRALLP